MRLIRLELKSVSFEYIDEIAAESNSGDLLELINLSFGVGKVTDNGFQLIDRLRDSRPMKRSLSRLMRDQASRDLIERRELVKPYNHDELMNLPTGTLGRVFAEVCRAMNYDINFYPSPEYFHNLETPADYVNYRVLATHDIHHIVTGFALNSAGEVGVISVSVEQFGFPGYVIIDISSLLKNWLTAEKPYIDIEDDLERARTGREKWKCITRGMEMGEGAALLFPIDWHALMHKDLNLVREELGITPVTKGISSWYDNPEIVAAINRV